MSDFVKSGQRECGDGSAGEAFQLRLALSGSPWKSMLGSQIWLRNATLHCGKFPVSPRLREGPKDLSNC